jgi:molybdate transport system substrate-binding protein
MPAARRPGPPLSPLGRGPAGRGTGRRACAAVALLCALALVVPLAACGRAAPRQTGGTPAGATAPGAEPLAGTLTVFATASLTDAFTEIGAAFEQAHPRVRVTFNFAASSALRAQLEQGARADVFASADQVQMDRARGAGTIEGAEQVFAKNRLVVIYPAGNPGRIAALTDLARPGLKLVLTDAAVPIGAYARAALERMAADPAFGPGFDQKVLANLRSEEANVRAVVTKVQLGEADAGIVYASDVTPAVAGAVRTLDIPDRFNTLATYPIARVRDAPNRAAARAFIDFVRAPAGQEILKKWNFIVDRDTGTG